jgi:steroid 5-alpha reductase family enzyme
MPAGFDKCQSEGGRIRTKTIGGGKYLHICFDKQGKSHAGEVKMKQSTKIEIVQVICAILVLATSIYITPRLDMLELLAWGIFGMAILVGSLVEAYKDIAKWKREREKLK